MMPNDAKQTINPTRQQLWAGLSGRPSMAKQCALAEGLALGLWLYYPRKILFWNVLNSKSFDGIFVFVLIFWSSFTFVW